VRTQRPSRLKTFDYIGLHRYSLTFCTDHHRKWFVSEASVALVLSHFLRAADNEQFAILVYCFMPDHVHLLIEGLTEASDCKRFIVRSKQYSAHAYSRRFNQRLWQPFAFEHVLRDDDKLHATARYILENPVRAGLAQRVLDYPFLGSQVLNVEDLLAGLPMRS
jgi:putative transposase